MVNFSGSFTVNGITDRDLVKILELKMKHQGKLIFNPQQLQPVNQQLPNQPQETHYNAAIFSFNSEDGMRAVYEVMDYLLHKEEKAEVAAR